MKKFLSLFLSIVMLLSITAGIDFSAYAGNNPYPGNSNSNCTYYVWQRTKDKLGIELPGWGNAKTWYESAKKAGYPVSSKPGANWIGVYDGGKDYNNQYRGHVIFVESVSGNTMTYSEGGYLGGTHTGKRNISANDGDKKLLGYFNPDKKAKVKITFNGNGGTVLGSSSLSVEKGKTVGNSLPSAKCAGKTFNGWYDSSGNRYSNNTKINKNIMLYANWVTNKSDLLKSHRVYRIVNTNSNMAIQANGSSNKASVSQQPKSNSYSQLWEVTNYSEGYYKFNVLNGRRTLDMTGGSIGLRTPYQIFNDTGSDNQRFSLVDRGSFYSIHSKSTGRALDIKDTSTSAGAQLQSYYYHGGGAQQFIFEEYTTRRLTFCDNLSNNYLTSLESVKANSMYTSRDKSYVTVSANRVSKMMTVKALKAGSASKSMTWETTCNRSHNFDFGAADTSKKYLIFRARSNVSGAKMNFRWGFDSSDPIASVTLSNSWQVFCIPMPRTLSSGGNIHPWIDRACTIELDNISLVDNTSDYNIHIDDSNTEKVLSVNSNNGKIGNNLPAPNTTKKGYHFVGWYTRRVGGTKVSEQTQMYTNQFLYAHWEKDEIIGEIIDPWGHEHICSYDSGTVTRTATCKTVGEKIYTCIICGKNKTETIPVKAHTYKKYTTKATTSKNGSVVTKCTACGEVKSKSTIYYPKTIQLSKTRYTYNGKVQTPTVTVKDSKGKTLKKDTDYTVTYAKGRKNVGKYSVKITFKGNYSGAKTLTFEIVNKPVNKWIKSGNRWWYRHADGSYTRNNWEKISGKWYHFDKSGWMQTGWLKTGGKWYYLNSSGAMQTGWIKLSNKWYYLNSSGAMVTGRQKIGNKYYTFNSNGVWIK